MAFTGPPDYAWCVVVKGTWSEGVLNCMRYFVGLAAYFFCFQQDPKYKAVICSVVPPK